MLPWNEKLFTSTQYLFNVSTTWQYMLIAIVVMAVLWVLVSIVIYLVNYNIGRKIELYIYRPVQFIGSTVVSIGALYYLIALLRYYIWGVG